MKKNRILAAALSITMLISIFGLTTNAYAAKNGKGPKNYKIHLKHEKLEPGRKKTSKLESTVENKSKTKPYIVVFDGPVTDEMKTSVEKAGAKLVEYLPDDSYLCLMTSKTVDNLSNVECVVDVIQYETDFKVEPELSKKITGENEEGEIEVVISTFDETQAVEDEIKKNDGSIITKSDNLIVASVKNNTVDKLAKFDAVKFIQENVKKEILNDIATGIIGAETASSIGYEGEGEIVCVADTGFDTGKQGLLSNNIHQDFRGRVIDIIAENANNPYGIDANGHGTHVSGSVLGDGARSNGKIKGTAPKAKLIMHSLGDSGEELVYEGTMYNLLEKTYNKGARIHTNSWGSDVKGAYTEECGELDRFVWDNKDMVVLFAAGNSGHKGYSSVGAPGSAKNCITVGATINYRPYLSESNDPDQIADFSSYGTVDGRIKPDVVAPGDNIASTMSSKADKDFISPRYLYPGNPYYQYMSGTSMSTPITAGAVAVIREYIRKNYHIDSPSAALIKAFLINGALCTGYDQEKGWGKVSLADSLMSTRILDDSSSLTVGQTKVYTTGCEVTESDKPLKISLVWTDYPASSIASKALVNDLDLKVTSPSGSVTYYGNDFSYPYNTEIDRTNNVENVIIQNPEIGTYKIEVTGYRVPNGPQPFAIVYSSDFLSTPKNVKASSSRDSITVSWDSVPGATSYDVEVDGINVGSVTGTSYTINNLKYSNEYRFRIRAKNQQKTGSWSNTLIRCTVLDSPEVTVKVVNEGIHISWNPVEGAEFYDVFIDGEYFASTIENEKLFPSTEKDTIYDVSVRARLDFNASNPEEDINVRNLDGGMSLKAPMLDARTDFGAVAASNGKVYVIGGKKGSSLLDTVEEYDISTDSWNNRKSPMPTKRINFAAVEADNGRIYVIGGENSTSALNTVEEYDPLNDRWTVKASMNTNRSGLRAVSLNGKIYAIGGRNEDTLNSVEVYDPVSDSWTKLQSPMYQKRSDFGVSVVNGKIYVVGGRLGSEAIDSVEVFDPVTGKWSFKQNMNKPNYDFSMTAIGDKIYCSGGENSDIIVEYDTVLDKWTDRRRLPESVKGHESVSKDGRVYVLGGYTGSSYVNTVVEYNPAEGLWERISNMDVKKTHFAAVEAGGKIYTFGGLGGGNFRYLHLDTVEVYDVKNNTWSFGAEMKQPVVFLDAVNINNRIFVCGGSNSINLNEIYNTMQEYDYINKRWIDKKSMPEPRSHHKLVALDGYIYVIGGQNKDGLLDKVLRYDPVNDSWETMKSSFPIPRIGHAVGTANGKIYVFGGASTESFRKIHEYDPLIDTWTEKSSLPRNFVQPNCLSLNNKIYVFQGSDIYEYDPLKDSFVEIQNLPFDMPRNRVVFCENKIFAIGGLFATPIIALDGVYCSDELLPAISLGNEVIDIKSSAKVIPVTLTNIPSDGIYKAEISFEYDPEKLLVTDVTPGAIIPGGCNITYNVDDVNGVVSIEYTDGSPIMNSGIFANVQVDVIDDVKKVGKEEIKLIRNSCKLYTDMSNELEAKKLVDGSVDIFMYGDLNGDGKINSVDKVLIDRYCLEILSIFPGEYGLLAADVNGDGKVNSTDGVLINRYVLQQITEFPVQQ